MLEAIKFESKDGVAKICLDRPDKLNALSPQMLVELRTVLKTVASDPNMRAVLIQASGRAFCAGVDLVSPRPGMNPADRDEMLRDYFLPAYQLLKELRIPTVASVNGPAIGAGMALALTCDVVVAGKSAYLQAGFVNIALVPDSGSSWLLRTSLGEARATGMLLLGERLPAATAADWGLIWRCVEDAELNDATDAIVQKLRSGPTKTYGLIKRVIRDQQVGGLRNAWLIEAEHQATVRESEDAKEARKAFGERRPPIFKGR